jgi:hypothetical protein
MQLFQIQPKDLFEYVFRLDIIHRNHWVETKSVQSVLHPFLLSNYLVSYSYIYVSIHKIVRLLAEVISPQ